MYTFIPFKQHAYVTMCTGNNNKITNGRREIFESVCSETEQKAAFPNSRIAYHQQLKQIIKLCLCWWFHSFLQFSKPWNWNSNQSMHNSNGEREKRSPETEHLSLNRWSKRCMILGLCLLVNYFIAKFL